MTHRLPLSLDTALIRIFGQARAEKIYAIAAVENLEPEAVACDALDLHLDALAGEADPREVAAAVSVHRLLTRPCEPVAHLLPCDCESAS
jgi:hypothetical protein